MGPEGQRRGGAVLVIVGAAAQALWLVGLGVVAAILGAVLGLTGRLELARHPGRAARRLRILADAVLVVGMAGLFLAGLVAAAQVAPKLTG